MIPPSIFLMDERVFMSLGVLKVAAAAEELGYPVEVLDLNGVENYVDVVLKHAAETDAKCFAITITTPQMPATVKIVDAIRSMQPTARIIGGGPHPTLVHAAHRRELRLGIQGGRGAKSIAQLFKHFNVVVAGDGEKAIALALEEKAPNFIDADDPASPLFLTNARLAETPLPARHLVDVDSYHYEIDGVRVLNLIAQLGCPFNCGFCGGRESAMLRRIRTRPTGSVIAEMRHLYERYDIRGFMFHDDELNVNKQVVELMNAIERLQQELQVEFRCRGFVKAELFTDQQAEAMYRAGFRRIMCGFESGSPRILKNINKKATREENTRAMEISKRAGLEMKALMSIGHPGESEQTIIDTRNWLLEVKPEDFDVTIITTYPGTPYYDHSVRTETPGIWKYVVNGDALYSDELDYDQVADYYKGDPNGGYKAYVFTDELSSEELVRWRDRVESEVRAALRIPFYAVTPAMRFEASMGQLPGSILRASL